MDKKISQFYPQTFLFISTYVRKIATSIPLSSKLDNFNSLHAG